MRWTLSRTTGVAALIGLLAATSTATADAQASAGTVVVSVKDAAGAALPQVQVSIVNTLLGGQTGEDGRVTIRSVPAGQQTVRSLRIGYAEQKSVVTVCVGQVAQVEFTLQTE